MSAYAGIVNAADNRNEDTNIADLSVRAERVPGMLCPPFVSPPQAVLVSKKRSRPFVCASRGLRRTDKSGIDIHENVVKLYARAIKFLIMTSVLYFILS